MKLGMGESVFWSFYSLIKSLIVCIAALGGANCCKTLGHRPDKAQTGIAIDGVPDVLDLIPKMVKILSWGHVFELALGRIPEILYGVEVGRLSRPAHNLNSIGRDPLLDPGSCMAGCVILLEDY